jgi:hypothetical protein
LENPDVYPDLTKPIGALNPQRRAGLHDRRKAALELADEPKGPGFLYGSFYSFTSI